VLRVHGRIVLLRELPARPLGHASTHVLALRPACCGWLRFLAAATSRRR
jgi:hypothetical protein